MSKKQLRASFLLLLCAFVWGSTFVAQSSAAKAVSPFAFLAARSFVGCFALLIVSLLFSLYRRKNNLNTTKQPTKKLILAGILCGIVLTVASACQQYGITLGTGAGKAGFLTALYLAFVPLLNFVFFRKKPGITALLGCAFALTGLFFLCNVLSDGKFAIADLVTACCGLCFAIHILIIDRMADDLDGVKLSCIQFFVCAVLSLFLAILLERTPFSLPRAALGSVLYAGIMSSALGYTLQIIGQKDCPASVATILMSLESVFALLSDSVTAFIHGLPIPINGTEFFGCLLMFVGVLLAQYPSRRKTQ